MYHDGRSILKASILGYVTSFKVEWRIPIANYRMNSYEVNSITSTNSLNPADCYTGAR